MEDLRPASHQGELKVTGRSCWGEELLYSSNLPTPNSHLSGCPYGGWPGLRETLHDLQAPESRQVDKLFEAA